MIGEFITRSEFEYRKYVQTLGISESDEIYGFGFKCYLQGINDNFKVVEEIALPEIAKRIEDDQFIAYIKNLLEHPESMVELLENCQPKKNNSFMFLKPDHFYEGNYFRQVPIDEINANPDYILPQDLLYKS